MIIGCYQPSLWRNWLARSAVNRKVGGSSPPRDVLSFYSVRHDICATCLNCFHFVLVKSCSCFLFAQTIYLKVHADMNLNIEN